MCDWWNVWASIFYEREWICMWRKVTERNRRRSRERERNRVHSAYSSRAYQFNQSAKAVIYVWLVSFVWFAQQKFFSFFFLLLISDRTRYWFHHHFCWLVCNFYCCCFCVLFFLHFFCWYSHTHAQSMIILCGWHSFYSFLFFFMHTERERETSVPLLQWNAI